MSHRNVLCSKWMIDFWQCWWVSIIGVFFIGTIISFAFMTPEVRVYASGLDEVPANNCPPLYARPRADFNGDGRNDLLFRDQVTRDLAIWFLDKHVRIATGITHPTRPVDSNWTPVGVNDFNRDCRSDILWQNDDSGNLAIWYMKHANSANVVHRLTGVLVIGMGPEWQVVGTGHFGPDHLDHYPDILWQHKTTGEVRLWYMQDTVILGEAGILTPFPSAEWGVTAVGNFNGDTWSDLLWRNRLTGMLRYSLLEGAVEIESGDVDPPDTIDPNWDVVSFFQVDGDGTDDIVWQNQTSGNLVAWYMNGSTRVSGGFFEPVGPGTPDLKVVGPK